MAYFRALRSGEGAERDGAGKVVLMGHSTGAQVCMEYVTGRMGLRSGSGSTSSAVPSTRAEPQAAAKAPAPASTQTQPPTRAPIAAIILQAGISDREALPLSLPTSTITSTTALAHSYLASARGHDILPSSATDLTFGASPSAARWLSLAERGGDDDYFSSDLSDAELEGGFGVVGRSGVPVCVLFSGEDEFVPAGVGKEVLVGRWEGVVRGNGGRWFEGSGVVEGAGHGLEGGSKAVEEVVKDVAGRVAAFLGRVESG